MFQAIENSRSADKRSPDEKLFRHRMFAKPLRLKNQGWKSNFFVSATLIIVYACRNSIDGTSANK